MAQATPSPSVLAQWRLKWCLSHAPEDAQVAELDQNGGVSWETLLPPGAAAHALAEVPVVEDAPHVMSIEFDDVTSFWGLDEDDEWPALQALKIENQDGRAINIGQFVVECCRYMRHIEETRNPDQATPVEERQVFWFLQLTGPLVDPDSPTETYYSIALDRGSPDDLMEGFVADKVELVRRAVQS